MEIREIRSLVILAECGTIQETAARCCLSPPAVHKHLKSIEDEFGVSIYTKHRGRLELTDAGRLLLPFAREILVQSQGALTAMHEWRDGRRGVVRVGAGACFSGCLLPALIKRYRNLFPDVEISVEITTGDRLVKRLRNGRFDLIFDLASSARDEPDIELLAQWESPAGFISNSSETPNPCRLEQLRQAAFILYEQDMRIERLVAAYFDRLGFCPKVIMRCDSAETIKAAIRAGLGVSVLFLWTLNSELPGSSLTILRTDAPPLISHMGLLRLKSRYTPRAVREFINMAEQESWEYLLKRPRDQGYGGEAQGVERRIVPVSADPGPPHRPIRR